MFKILIVDDESYKVKYVYQILEQVIGLDIENVTTVMDANEAKKLLKVNHYDLLILDIVIPMKISQNPDPEGGIKLLEEVLKRGIYKIPTHIIGLSSKTESFEIAVGKFKKDTLTIVKFDEGSDEWQNALLSGVQHRVSSKQNQLHTLEDYNYDVAIICALKEELEANLQNGWEWAVADFLKHDDTVYYQARIPNMPQLRIIAAHAMRMGIPAATTLATKMIYNFRPKLIIMTGIMAGVSSKTRLGDTIMGNPVWDWGSGKWTTEVEDLEPQNLTSVFQIEPFQYKPDTRLVKYISLLEDDRTYFFKIRDNFKGSKPEYDIRLLTGPIASGASVLANKSKFNEVIGQNRKLLGIEMESYGVMCAADSVSNPKPLAMCIKTVVDFGDKEKSDNFHEFGCYTSARIAKKIIEDYHS